MAEARKRILYPTGVAHSDEDTIRIKCRRGTREDEFKAEVEKAKAAAIAEIENENAPRAKSSVSQSSQKEPAASMSSSSAVLPSTLELHQQSYNVWKVLYPRYQKLFRNYRLMMIKLNDFNTVLTQLLSKHQTRPHLITSSIDFITPPLQLTLESQITTQGHANLIADWKSIYVCYTILFQRFPMIINYLHDMNLMLTSMPAQYHQLLYTANVMVQRTRWLLEEEKLSQSSTQSKEASSVLTAASDQASSVSVSSAITEAKAVLSSPISNTSDLSTSRMQITSAATTSESVSLASSSMDLTVTDKESEWLSDLLSSSETNPPNKFMFFSGSPKEPESDFFEASHLAGFLYEDSPSLSASDDLSVSSTLSI